MNRLFLILFAVACLIHLFFSWKDMRKARACTKPFPLLFLMLYYITGAGEIETFLILALFFSWIGDILLIPPGKGWFVSGGSSFLLAHLFFILLYAGHIQSGNIPWFVVISVTILYFFLAFLLARAMRNEVPKRMIAAMFLYMLMNSCMNVFALLQLFSMRSMGSIVACIGANLFFASDCALFLVRFYRKRALVFKRHFTVMLTYLLGEYFITVGMMLVSR